MIGDFYSKNGEESAGILIESTFEPEMLHLFGPGLTDKGEPYVILISKYWNSDGTINKKSKDIRMSLIEPKFIQRDIGISSAAIQWANRVIASKWDIIIGNIYQLYIDKDAWYKDRYVLPLSQTPPDYTNIL